MKATPKTNELTALKESFNARYWALHGEDLSEAAIEDQLSAEGCPTAFEVEACFFEETGMSFEAAGELMEAKRQLEAEARYDERYCR